MFDRCDLAEVGVGVIIHIQNSQSSHTLLILPCQGFKKLAFGLKITVIGSVVIQVLMGNIGHRRQVKIDLCYPLLHQPMGCSLQHHMRQPSIPHSGEVALNVGCLRRGHVETSIQDFLAHHSVDRGDHPDFVTCRLQYMIDEVGGGGLAVRACHANHHHLL